MNAITKVRFEPCLPSLALVPPRGEGWTHEIKWDGYRAGVVIESGVVRVLSRRGKDLTAKVPAIVEAASRLEVRSAVLDGEAVVLDDAGISRLSLLRNALGRAGAGILLMAFDLLELDGVDLRSEALSIRRERLSHVLAGCAPTLRLSESFDAPAAEIYATACRLGVEGIVSKRSASPYRGGRQRTWLKMKCWEEVECVVVGYEPLAGRSSGVGSLLLGEERDGNIVYLGRLGAGLTAALARDLMMRWRASTEPACALPADRRRQSRWVVPEVAVRVRRLQGEDLRHASLLGLVPSLPARLE